MIIDARGGVSFPHQTERLQESKPPLLLPGGLDFKNRLLLQTATTSAFHHKHGKTEILLEYYDFEPDAEIVHVLCKASEAGVPVHVTYDHLPFSRRGLVKQAYSQLQHAGVVLEESFRPKGMLPHSRNHRKIATFTRGEEIIALSGGINLTERNIEQYKDFGFEYYGSVAEGFREIALANIQKQPVAWDHKRKHLNAQESLLLDDANLEKTLELIGQSPPNEPLIITSPGIGAAVCDALSAQARNGRTNLYAIFPANSLFSLSSFPPINYLHSRMLDVLDAAGVHVFLYDDPSSVYNGKSHAKAIAVRNIGALSTTHNFSRRIDWGQNLEVGYFSTDKEFVDQEFTWLTEMLCHSKRYKQ